MRPTDDDKTIEYEKIDIINVTDTGGRVTCTRKKDMKKKIRTYDT